MGFFFSNKHLYQDNKQQMHLLLIVRYMCIYICCLVVAGLWLYEPSVSHQMGQIFFFPQGFNVKHLILPYYCCAQQQLSFFPLKRANSGINNMIH